MFVLDYYTRNGVLFGPISTAVSHEEKHSNVSSLELLSVAVLGQAGILILSSKDAPEISVFSRDFLLKSCRVMLMLLALHQFIDSNCYKKFIDSNMLSFFQKS